MYLSSEGVKHRFFMVHSFIRPLRDWIKQQKSRGVALEKGGLVGGSSKGGSSKFTSVAATAAPISFQSSGTTKMLSSSAPPITSPLPASHKPEKADGRVPTATDGSEASRQFPLLKTGLGWLDFRFDRDSILKCL